jgi:hypothetical protein
MWEEVNLFRKRSVEYRTSTIDLCQANCPEHLSQDRVGRRWAIVALFGHELDEPFQARRNRMRNVSHSHVQRLPRCGPIFQRTRLLDPTSNPRPYLTISLRLLRPVPVLVASIHKKCLVT